MLKAEATVKSLGDAVDECIREGFAVWRKMHHPGTSGELAFTDEAYKIESTCTVFQAGKVRISVYVHGRKGHQRDYFVWNFVRGSNGTLTLESKA